MQSKQTDLTNYEPSQLIRRGSYFMCQECLEEIPSEVAKHYKIKNDIKFMNGTDDNDAEMDEFKNHILFSTIQAQSLAEKEKIKNYKGCSCVTKNPEAKTDICPHGVLEALLYIHIPPKLDDVYEDDRECMACIKSLEPSDSFNQVHLCERGIVDTMNGETPSFEQI